MYLYNINLKSKPNDKKGMSKTRYVHITVYFDLGVKG